MDDTKNRKQSALFDTLFAVHSPRIYRLCLRLCGGRTADAEDLTQDTLVAAFGSLPHFQGRAAISTYLYAIAVLRWRKRRAKHEIETVSLPETLEHRTPDPISERLTRLSLNAAMDALPNDLREAFALVKAEGLTHKEAARLLGVPQGTVQWRVHEAVRRLRVLLAEESPLGGNNDA